MDSTEFDVTVADSQATVVAPVTPAEFDFEAYEEHEAMLLETCRAFQEAPSGVLVHRRMRVREVFSYGCRDMRRSLEFQLGALTQSLGFQMDIPNFLEPWYGIGTVASAYGFNYEWYEGQAPAGRTLFRTVEEALRSKPMPVRETAIGRHTLLMIEYFLEETGGRLPMSLTDVQSPFNVACHVVDLNALFMEVIMNPGAVKELLDRIAELMVEWTDDQLERMRGQVVWPGHGFASSRPFKGMGMSDDNSLMIFPDHYFAVAEEADARAGAPFGGLVFHSCGNWTNRVDMVKQLEGLRAVDGAFSKATDPAPNSPERFAEAFAGTGITVNARIVGEPRTVEDIVKRLWRPDMKLAVVTYCRTPSKQQEAYERVHGVCG